MLPRLARMANCLLPSASVQLQLGTRQQQRRVGTRASEKQSKFPGIPCSDSTRFRPVGEKSPFTLIEGVLRTMAFHEKAGRCQVRFFVPYVIAPRTHNIATVAASKITCSVFGRMPLRSGRK